MVKRQAVFIVKVILVLTVLLLLEYSRETISDLSERLASVQSSLEEKTAAFDTASQEAGYWKSKYSLSTDSYLQEQLEWLLESKGVSDVKVIWISLEDDDLWKARVSTGNTEQQYAFSVRFDKTNSPRIFNLRLF